MGVEDAGAGLDCAAGGAWSGLAFGPAPGGDGGLAGACDA